MFAAAAAQVAGRSFMPLQYSKKPDGSSWTKEPVLQTRGSKFIKFQEARIQVSSTVDSWPGSAVVATPPSSLMHLRISGSKITTSQEACNWVSSGSGIWPGDALLLQRFLLQFTVCAGLGQLLCWPAHIFESASQH